MTETRNKYKLNNNTNIKIATTNEFGESKIRKYLKSKQLNDQNLMKT